MASISSMTPACAGASLLANPPQPGRAVAVTLLRSDPEASLNGHDLASKSAVAAGLAELLECDYIGVCDVHEVDPRTRYCVPSHTLNASQAAALGIEGENDLFGGVVPHPFVATKLITHPLVGGADVAPVGWAHQHAALVAPAVLPGYSVFSHADALTAAQLLLPRGPVRLKDPAAAGGLGQWVVQDMKELRERLQAFRPEALAQGLVLELNLSQVRTLSVGQVRAGGLLISYHGTQCLTRNYLGDEVYGGSSLDVYRGDFERLLGTSMPAAVRHAIEQARAYHRAAQQCYEGFFASRCNYDVVQGLDDAGQFHSGVLEQSWRIGGASGAEVAALQMLQADPALGRVAASTTEVYGPVETPANAWVLFDGTDAEVGRLTKYAQVVAGRAD
jgi:hypothetical protein